MSSSTTSRQGWTGGSWFGAHLGSVILHFLLLAQVWRISQQHATLQMACVLACWFLGALLASWRSSRGRNGRAGWSLFFAGMLILTWIMTPKGVVPAFLFPYLWQMAAAMILALIMGAAGTRWLGSARSVGEGTRQMGEVLHSIFALVLVWSLPPSLIGIVGVLLLLPLLICDSLQRKQNTPLPARPSLPRTQWRRTWWVIYLAGRRQLGVLLLAGCVSLLLDVVIGTILTPVGAETAHHHTLGLLWYGIEGQLVAVLLGAYLVSANQQVLGPTRPLIPEGPGIAGRFLFGSALVMIAASILAFGERVLFTTWALPFILGNFTFGLLLWSRLLPRLCPPLSADLQRLPFRPLGDPAFWTTVDGEARTRVERITGVLRVVCVPAVGWGIEQWGLSSIFLVTGGTLIGLVLLAAVGWAMTGRLKQEELREDLLKEKRRREPMQRQPEDTTADQGRESRWRSLFWCVALLATGALLWWIGGSMPPLAWREVAQVLRDIATTRPLFPLLLAQGALLLAAWGVLLLLAVRVIARFFQPWSAPVSQHPRRKQEMQAQTVRPEAVNAQERPSTHTRPEALSVPLMTEVTREAALNPTHEAPELALLGQLDEEDFTDPFPAWSNPSAIFGQALQVTVASLSDEGMQLVPATKAYLLTEKSGKDDTHPSLSFNFIALADHLSAEEQGYTASCRAIETMKDLVMRACMVMHNASEEALAALLAEQVQKVIRIIGEQRSGEETHPAMVAALIIGSTMIVEKIGDMRIYLCHAKEGFSQLSQTLPVVRPLETDTAIPSRSQAQQVRRKKRDRGSGSPLTFEQDRKAVSLLAGDRILLCSDGVWTVLHASYLEHILRFSGPDLADVRAALLQATRKSGSTDPVSIMVVQCQ